MFAYVVAELSFEELYDYCELAKLEFGAENVKDAELVLQERYGWNIYSRQEEFTTAWNHTKDIGRTHGTHTSTANDCAVGASTTVSQVSGRVPLHLKKDLCTKTTLLCEIDDDKLSFRGDTGAIGRVETENKLFINLKGNAHENIA